MEDQENFMLHLNSKRNLFLSLQEYNFQLKSYRRNKIIELLKDIYFEIIMNNLPIYGVSLKDLNDLSNTKLSLLHKGDQETMPSNEVNKFHLS